MKRIAPAPALMVTLTVGFGLAAAADDPVVSKRALMETDEGTVIVLTVSGSDRAVYGMTITDASASIEDIVAPDGWAGVAGEDKVVFRTVDKPVTSGSSVAFRIVTRNAAATYEIVFSDAKTRFGAKKTL